MCAKKRARRRRRRRRRLKPGVLGTKSGRATVRPVQHGRCVRARWQWAAASLPFRRQRESMSNFHLANATLDVIDGDGDAGTRIAQ